MEPGNQNGTAINGAAALWFHYTPISGLALAETPATATVRTRKFSYLNCGIVGTVMCGCGSCAVLAALPIPLGSTLILFMPPTLAGPGGMPLIGTFPAPAPPAIRANEAAGGAKASSNATAIFAEVLDMAKLHDCSTRTSTDDTNVGRQFARTIKMNFRKRFGV
jgi:hypothetical protein